MDKAVDAMTIFNHGRSVSLPAIFSLISKRKKPAALLSLCLGVLGMHLEDIVSNLYEIAAELPVEIKMAIMAIARRKRILDDDTIIALVDNSWEILDVSGSDVSDTGLAHVANQCKFLRAIDISQCSQVTPVSISEVLQQCGRLEILRCGGAGRKINDTMRHCLGILRPTFSDVDGDSWEEMDSAEVAHNAQSLHWLVWGGIDDDSREMLASECPRIVVNPKHSPIGFRGMEIPREALQDEVLDDPVVKDIDPETWAARGVVPPRMEYLPRCSTELSVAEKFRLAFMARDTRLAPKRAKNARQHQRRAQRELMLVSSTAKANALASVASKSIRGRNQQY